MRYGLMRDTDLFLIKLKEPVIIKKGWKFLQILPWSTEWAHNKFAFF